MKKTNYLDPMLGLPSHEVVEYLGTLTESQTKNVQEEMEYYLLCYPQGTGDDELEELLETLSEVFYEM